MRFNAFQRARRLGGNFELLKELVSYGEAPGWVIFYLAKLGPCRGNSGAQWALAKRLWMAKARHGLGSKSNLVPRESKLIRELKTQKPFSWGA